MLCSTCRGILSSCSAAPSFTHGPLRQRKRCHLSRRERGLGRPVLAVLDEQGLVFAQAAWLRRNGQQLRTLPALPERLRGESRNAKSPQRYAAGFWCFFEKKGGK